MSYLADVVLSILSVAGFVAVGEGWNRLLLPCPWPGRIVRLGYDGSLGLCLLPLSLFLLGLGGVPVGRFTVLGAAVAPIVFGAIRRAGVPDPAPRPGGGRLDRVEKALLAMVLFGLGTVALSNVTFPLRDWDGRATWNLKATLLASEGQVLGPAFTDVNRFQPHPRYPLLWPLAQSSVYLAAGRRDALVARSLSTLALAGLAAILFAETRRARGRPTALALTALLCTVPALTAWIDGGAIGGYADPILAAFAGAALAAGLASRDGRAGAGAVCGVFLAGAVLTKVDGLAHAAGLLAALAVAALVGRDRGRRRVLLRGAAVAALFAIAAVALYAIWSHLIPDRLDENHLGYVRPAGLWTHRERFGLVARHWGGELLATYHWGLFWPGLILLGLLEPAVWKSREMRLAGPYAAVVVAVATSVYLQAWSFENLMKVTTGRVLIQLLPAALLALSEPISRLVSRRS
jgi:hypothetical protein